MDLINYDQERFLKISRAFDLHVEDFGFSKITAIPVSALLGDNITTSSKKMTWYQGSTLMNALEKAPIHQQEDNLSNKKWVMPIQMVNRPHSEFRGFQVFGVFSVNE
jgi:bifunctional enzyme CysN/CysC